MMKCSECGETAHVVPSGGYFVCGECGMVLDRVFGTSFEERDMYPIPTIFKVGAEKRVTENKSRITRRVLSARDNRMKVRFVTLRAVSAHFSTGHHVFNHAWLILKRVGRVQNTVAAAAAALTAAFRRYEIPITMREVAAAAGLTVHQVWLEFRRLHKRGLAKHTNPVDPALFIPKIVEMFGARRAFHAAYQFLSRFPRHAKLGRDPVGVAAAAVYLANASIDDPVGGITQQRLAKELGVTPVTIRTNIKLMRGTPA